MTVLNFDNELKFINSEKSISNKKSLVFELLNATHVLLANYVGAHKKKTKDFYKIVYLKTKKFYLEQAK